MKGQWLKLFVVTVAILLLVGACVPAATPPSTPTPIPPSPTPDPAAPVQAWVDALNSGDVDAALAPFADDVQYHFIFDAIRKEHVRSVFEWLVGIEAKYKIVDCQQPQSDRVECAFTVNDGCIIPYGAVDSLAVKGVYVFGDDGKIKQVTGATEGVEWDNYWKYGDAVLAWQKANRAEEASTVENFPPKEGGAVQIKLCKEYAESLKAAPEATAVTTEPMSEAEKLARTVADAHDRGDLDAAMALFVDEGLSYFEGSNAMHDKKALRSSWESGIGLGETLDLIDCGPEGEVLRCTALVRNDYCYKAWCGLDLYHSELTLRTKEGKIQFMAFRDGLVTAEDRKACDEAWPKYAAWASANRAEEWKKLNAPVAYDLKGRPLGELESSLCKAYLEATKK